MTDTRTIEALFTLELTRQSAVSALCNSTPFTILVALAWNLMLAIEAVPTGFPQVEAAKVILGNLRQRILTQSKTAGTQDQTIAHALSHIL